MPLDERSSEVQRALLREASDRHEREITEMRERQDREFSELREEIAEHYVTKDQFEPVRLVAYGAVSILLGSLLVAIVGLILTKQS